MRGFSGFSEYIVLSAKWVYARLKASQSLAYFRLLVLFGFSYGFMHCLCFVFMDFGAHRFR